MKITLLGTGDAPGTPVIGCGCPACRDAAAGGKSRRTRFSVLAENDYTNAAGETVHGRILIDTSPDMRIQLLKQKLTPRDVLNPDGNISPSVIDGIVWTHPHLDHFGGFGEFYRVQYRLDVYGIPETVDSIGRVFHYLSAVKHYQEFGKSFSLIGLDFTLFEVHHDPIEKPAGVIISDGIRKIVISGDTDTKIPEESLALMADPDLFIVDAIVPKDPKFVNIKKHLNADEAAELAAKIRSKKTYFTHLSHYYPPHDEASSIFPLAWDGLSFEFDRRYLSPVPSLMLLFDADVWFRRLVLLFDVAVWCCCLVLLFGAAVWCCCLV
ncbi:MBL fold metallo-hydrolase, partial [Methanosarcinaceae archaeon]|nr:MBL fold metallo-hydrolase [Methanosarcinaceae archaeon]